ncbi:LacI family DNA-binding transcriptional regulator [Opitutus sp. ER46]|uniref:LacI family DNA-binding transcriptional regulator n=1 Tax=Opitutus sp. ER46 TaxID=2161864 RepID=UPI000D306E0C|nr:LacI family DNA-binding transcriptional regulator [Opitutus sp. ER46]PTX91665.1 LacI family transcriptional regulator [Opitutus sp. ER46]
MKTRVTQTDIARAAGVHNTTVSLALRNSPAIPEATRARIQAIAEEMGYHPDPALQALVAYRNGRMPARCHGTIAYVTNATSRWGWQSAPADAKFYAGAQRKAEQSGFQLEHFWCGEPDVTPRRLSNMLFHRGITGVILASHRPECDALGEMDWSHFTAIKIGCFPHSPGLHRVMYDRSGVIRLAMKQALAAGYERIGLVMPTLWDDAADQAWSAGFLAEQYRLPEESRIPILLYGERGRMPDETPDRTGPAVDIAALAAWYNRHEPEVIISIAPFVREQLTRLKLNVPRDVGYVDLFLEGTEHGVAGICENCERVGEVATELLVAQMHQNLTGLPPVPTTTLVEGRWTPGATLPMRRHEFGWAGEVAATSFNGPILASA